MIVAAGRGQRLRPLTDATPKPLLKVGGKALIEYHLEALSKAGFKEVVINLYHLADQIMQALGDGQHYGLTIHYSREVIAGLESGGGIFQALPLLGDAPFLVVNSDIWTDYPFHQLPKKINGLAHLVLVNNPSHNPQGDFALNENCVSCEGNAKLTFAGINIYHPHLFANCKPGMIRMPELLMQPMQAKQVSGEHYTGTWVDVGTVERLNALNAQVRRSE